MFGILRERMVQGLLIGGMMFHSLQATARELTPADIRDRFTVKAEVFVFDKTGEHLLARMSETSAIKGAQGAKAKQLTETWASRSGLFDGVLSMKAVWGIGDDGVIKVALTEYASDSKEPRDGENRYARVLKTEERVVHEMNAINWVSVNDHKDKKVVVRYTPNLSDDIPQDVTETRVAGEDITIADNAGRVWADHISMNGKYVGLTTHRGALILSYYPFPGAVEMGIAKGHRMDLSLGGNVVVSLISKTDFLPGTLTGKIYGIYKEDHKSGGLTVTHVSASNREDEVLKRFK